ncbi:hypothetical protein [Corynebacterium mayonis]|uniref:GAP1-N2 domain-containing protein n=1 Tax=Corynebacterium mayonis TaxID=3062461 RepID=UPI0031405646
MSDMRWSHLTYSSFLNASGGGWQIGERLHTRTGDDELARAYAFTAVSVDAPVDDFASSEEIARLPRRCEYHIDGGKGVFVQALPVGKDATRRPGNVFNHIVIDHEPAGPAQSYPIQWYRSRDLIEPFGHRAVNKARLDQSVGEPRASEIGDIFAAWIEVRGLDEDRIGALYALMNLLSESAAASAVIATVSTDEAAVWITALSSTLPRDVAAQLLQFSTFSRASDVEAANPTMPTVFAIPLQDLSALSGSVRTRVVNPADSATWAEPKCEWAQCIAAAIAAGKDGTELTGLASAPPEWLGDEREELPVYKGTPTIREKKEFENILNSSKDPLEVLSLADAWLQEGTLNAEELELFDEYWFSRDGRASLALSSVLDVEWEPEHPAMVEKWEQLRRKAALASFLIGTVCSGIKLRSREYWSGDWPLRDLEPFSREDLCGDLLAECGVVDTQVQNALEYVWLQLNHPHQTRLFDLFAWMQHLSDNFVVGDRYSQLRDIGRRSGKTLDPDGEANVQRVCSLVSNSQPAVQAVAKGWLDNVESDSKQGPGIDVNPRGRLAGGRTWPAAAEEDAQ